MYSNCQSIHTGIYAPHTLYVCGKGISIVYGDCIKYYTEQKHFKPIAKATDERGFSYTIYSDNDGVVAIPKKNDRRFYLETPKKGE